ncbi:MAG: hypothetical protein GF364_00395 [Candidatus Lokiarchaeota archaeon]|nr:hypothetical protein [Candidatus Lokiarchaeota archaeon]
MLERFVNKLRNRDSNSLVYNFYKDKGKIDNLNAYLHFMKKQRPTILLVGEAPGYKGCRKTGIPFTSGNILALHRLYQPIRTKLTYNKKDKEMTATIVYSVIDERIFKRCVFWNSFPFHPHEKDKHKTNRPPTSDEIKEGRSYLNLLDNIFQFEIYAGIGKSGIKCLDMVGCENSFYIRHPSHGGKREFTKGLLKLIWLDMVRYS